MTLTVSSNPMEQIEQTSNALVKEMPSNLNPNPNPNPNPNANPTQVARQRLPAASVRAVHACGLQDFRPIPNPNPNPEP